MSADQRHLVVLINFKNNINNLIADHIDNNPLYREELSPRRAQIHSRMANFEVRLYRLFQLPPSLPNWSFDNIYLCAKELMEIMSDVISYQFDIVQMLVVRDPPPF